jgi:ribosomal protein S12 methylthiotransferase accessory factor
LLTPPIITNCRHRHTPQGTLQSQSFIVGKDASLESTITTLQDKLAAPGFDMEEIASSPNIEIHFVDSSGLIHWDFLSSQSNFPFHDWNFSNTTAENYAWSVAAIHKLSFDIYVADFLHLGVYACRIIVPGMSEIYLVDELEWENNSIGNDIREAILNLSDLDHDECSKPAAA